LACMGDRRGACGVLKGETCWKDLREDLSIGGSVILKRIFKK